MNLDEIRKPWDKLCLAHIERWMRVELGLMTIERWQAERRDIYFQFKKEMESCGSDFFFPPSLKLLVQIKTPADDKIQERWEKGWEYCREKASMNEIDLVINGLGLLDSISRCMKGPYGYVIYGLEGGGFTVDVPEVSR
jgi:hypothetical protein